jgi:hypothetical protein
VTRSATPDATDASTALPSSSPLSGSAAPLVRRSAREIGLDAFLAPGPGGDLFVSIPRSAGSVLALLDRGGAPRPGWPIVVRNSTWCGRPLPVRDGSVRIVCDGTDLPRFDNDLSDVRAFAFDARGKLMSGWPLELRPGMGHMAGEELVFLEQQILTDTADVGVTLSHNAWLTTIAANGAIRSGTPVPMVETCCGESWSVGPDGIAYGVGSVGEWFDGGSAELSRAMALDLSGMRAGWPVQIDGIASGPAFGPDGRIVVTVGSFVERTSRVLVFDRDGTGVSASSATLPIATGALFEFGVDGPYECGVPKPNPPLVAQDGTTFVFSEIDSAILALDLSLEVQRGWPYEPATPLERPNPRSGHDGISCPSLSVPAVGPDSTLYLPLQARDSTIGGRIVAVDRDGQVRPGWPVELTRPGAEFWSVVVGSDGTAYALAIEPESGDTSSATILAIAPDSTVRWTTTIVEP